MVEDVLLDSVEVLGGTDDVVVGFFLPDGVLVMGTGFVLRV